MNEKSEDLWEEVRNSEDLMVSLYALREGEKISSTIARNYGKRTSQIAASFRELEEMGLAECITPQKHRNRYYKLTEKGKELLEEKENLLESRAKAVKKKKKAGREASGLVNKLYASEEIPRSPTLSKEAEEIADECSLLEALLLQFPDNQKVPRELRGKVAPLYKLRDYTPKNVEEMKKVRNATYQAVDEILKEVREGEE